MLNIIYAEMSGALAGGEPVEFPFGYLARREKDSPFFEWDGEPLQLYTVEHYMDDEGDWLLNPEGWNSRPSKTALPQWTKPRLRRGRPKKPPAAETARSR